MDKLILDKADIMNFEEEKSYNYTSDWDFTLVRVFDHYIWYLRGKKTVPDPWLCEMTQERLAELDKKKNRYNGPVMFGEFLRVFFKNPFHSPFRKVGDRYQLASKNGWLHVSYINFFTTVRDYLWYHFRQWSKELLLVIGVKDFSPRNHRKRLKNLSPLLAKRMNGHNPGCSFICEDDQIRFVKNWLTPRIKGISDVPCINFAALKALLEKCGGINMITF